MDNFMVGQKRKIIIALVILLILPISYWTILRPVFDSKLNYIYVERLDKDTLEYIKMSSKYDLGLSDQQVNDILNNPNEYRYIVYEFNMRNITKSRSIGYMKLKSNFVKELSNCVVGYQKYDGESPIILKPLSKPLRIRKFVLVKVNGKANDELIELAKKGTFLVTGYVTGKSLLDIGYSFKTVKLDAK